MLIKRSLLAVAIATTLVGTVPTLTLANGITIFGGVGRENALPATLDYDGIPNQFDRYRFRIPQKKLTEAVQQFTISYVESPAKFTGKFDPDEVELRIKGQPQPLSEVIWDEENQLIEIYPENPIPAGSPQVEIWFSNVKNPGLGLYRFKCLILTPGDVPLPRYIGTWELSIGPS